MLRGLLEQFASLLDVGGLELRDLTKESLEVHACRRQVEWQPRRNFETDTFAVGARPRLENVSPHIFMNCGGGGVAQLRTSHLGILHRVTCSSVSASQP